MILMQNWLQDVQDLKQYLYIDENDFLKEKCSEPQRLKQLIATGEQLFWKYREEDRMKICGVLGNLYRLKGDIKTALPYLERYKDYCYDHESNDTYIVAIIRYAEGLRIAKQYQDALICLEEVLEQCITEKLSKYENYAWQFKGKCYLELGDMRSAESCFLKALLLRKELDEPNLLEASESTLNFMMNLKK